MSVTFLSTLIGFLSRIGKKADVLVEACDPVHPPTVTNDVKLSEL